MIADAPTPDELALAALDYARRGMGVFPLHTPINGVCDCPRGPGCGSPGKHPRTANGLKDASVDELQVRRWWRTYPIANIGLAVPDGYVVVDVDGPEGQDALRDAARALPPTAIQTTGRGAHYVYRTLGRIPPRSNLMPKVDLRGPGSYIVAAPSVHASGAVYGWAVPLDQVDAAPRWLAEVGQQSGGTTEGPRSPVDFEAVLAGLSEGERKWEIYRAASKLRGADVPIGMAVALAREAAAKCSPPLPASEAERKVREAYAKHNPNVAGVDLPADVELIGQDGVLVRFETCLFAFTDLEKSGRELHAAMEVQSLLPGMPQEPYVQRLNLLSISSREACRREMEHVLGNPGKGHWTALLARAVAKAQSAFLSVDRSIRSSEIMPLEALEFIVPDICVADGFSILFGAGSAGKTFILMKLAIAVSRGDPFLGRPTRPRNVLYIDCETGQRTYGYRLRRLLEGEGLGMDAAAGIHYWWAQGLPLEDQVDAIRRCCDTNDIEFICLDHIAAACGGDASEQAVASRFARAVGKIGRPMMALAHITGADLKNPEAVQKPFGSIFWENGARRTIFLMRQQDDDSPVAELGFYPRKINDGGRISPFGARLVFDDPSGPITLDAEPMRSMGSNLRRISGAEHAISDVLSYPMTVAEIADATGLSERHVKRTLADHAQTFVMVSGHERGGRSRAKTWAKLVRDSKQWWQDKDELPF